MIFPKKNKKKNMRRCALGFGSEYQKCHCPYGVSLQADCVAHCGYLYVKMDDIEPDMPIYKALHTAIFGDM